MLSIMDTMILLIELSKLIMQHQSNILPVEFLSMHVGLKELCRNNFRNFEVA